MDWDKKMEAALIADGEKLRALTGEDHGPWDLPKTPASWDNHEAMTVEGVCPRCDGKELWQESVDVGVGVIYGPWGCPNCGWSESPEYDLAYGGGVQANGSYLDPYGGKLPAANPIAKMLAAEVKQ